MTQADLQVGPIFHAINIGWLPRESESVLSCDVSMDSALLGRAEVRGRLSPISIHCVGA